MNFECKNFKDKIIVILMGIGFIALYIFASAFLSVLITALPYSKTYIGMNIYAILVEAIITTLLVLIGHKKIFADFKDFKKNYKKIIKTAFTCWLIGFIIMMISNLLINKYITNGAIADNESTNREFLLQYPIYSILGICFFGPICEEILFRLSFKSAFKNIVLYCLFTGIFFAGMHVVKSVDALSIANIIKNWRQLLFIISYLSLGVMFSYGFFKTNNIFTSMIMHIFHNSLTIAMYFFALSMGVA